MYSWLYLFPKINLILKWTHVFSLNMWNQKHPRSLTTLQKIWQRNYSELWHYCIHLYQFKKNYFLRTIMDSADSYWDGWFPIFSDAWRRLRWFPERACYRVRCATRLAPRVADVPRPGFARQGWRPHCWPFARSAPDRSPRIVLPLNRKRQSDQSWGSSPGSHPRQSRHEASR